MRHHQRREHPEAGGPCEVQAHPPGPGVKGKQVRAIRGQAPGLKISNVITDLKKKKHGLTVKPGNIMNRTIAHIWDSLKSFKNMLYTVHGPSMRW